MKQRFLYLLFIGLSLGFVSHGQIVGPNGFLQGHWLEVGVDSLGAFGTCSSPAGYHAHGPASSTFGALATCHTVNDELDACYDWGHDGWDVGVPCEMGDYTIPGYPQEGWGIELAGTEYRNWAAPDACGGTYNIPGGLTSYSNTGGTITVTWTGNVGGVHIIQETRVDTEASWAVVTTRLYNTTAAPITGVYYERTCDPDNTSFWPGGTSETENVIVHQNEDATHRVMVGSYGTTTSPVEGTAPDTATYFYNRYDSWLSLATKDCRARCMVIDELFPTTTPSALWVPDPVDASITVSTVNDSNSADEGIALVINIGTLAALGSPGDSAIVSYAYIYDGPNGIDSAFPDPVLVADTTAYQNAVPVPSPSYDTFYSCSYPGLVFIPLKVLNASDKDWSWSTWTWSPSAGLASTTGVNNTLNISALAGPVTYTITGTDSAVDMYSCHNRVFYLTVFPCSSVSSNSPGPLPGNEICLSDTLKLASHGDSTDATYFWYGPAGYTSTGQFTFRTGLTLADTGLYYGVKTVDGVSDTAHTRVFLKPLPTATLTSNGPICSGGSNTLILTASPDSTGETFNWVGPLGFTSILENPTALGLPTTGSGTYKVYTSFNGCGDSASIFVTIDSTPAVPAIGSNAPVCSHRDTLKFTASDATGGVSYLWAGPLGFNSVLPNPEILPDAHVTASGIYTVTVTLVTDGFACSSPNTINIVVDSTPYLPLVSSSGVICTGTELDLTASSTIGAQYHWTGPDSYVSVVQNPIISPAPTTASGTYSVTATIIYPGIARGCSSDVATVYAEVDSTPVLPTASSNSPGAPGPTLCEGDTLKLFATDPTSAVSYLWNGPYGYTSTLENPVEPHIGTAGTGSYTVTATLGICRASAIITVTITPTPPLTATNNGPLCTGIADTLLLQAFSGPGATYTWAGPYTFSSANQNPFRTPVIYEYGGVYQVTASLFGCTSNTINDTVVVRQTPAPPSVAWPTFCLDYAAPPLQAMGDSILWYPTDTANGIGSLTAPVPSTTSLGVSWFFVSQTLMNCTSYLDSVRVTVNPKPTVTLPNDTFVCPHDSIILTAVDNDALTYYHWTPSIYLSDTSSATVIARPETSTTYSVVATNEYGCTDTAQTTITVQAAAVINLGDSVTLYPGQSYQLEPLTNCSVFSWSPPDGLSDPHVSSPLATPGFSTIYTVEGATSWGCVTTASISIYVDNTSTITLPNAFAPGTGPNNIFKILKRGDVTLNYFRIFDRWGVKVFEATDVDQGWDGTYEGKPQPFGVYVYEISAVVSKSGAVINKHGNVTLIR